ncbi:hypothetical protein [Klebsiella michiganensis]|uniref:hypothetical protein n=1 Tax=Klebsiella michiganensis TaxID=1134687 RepID=UPI0012BA1A8C|nr:hypothetical protein [Klebsiella michiganensis]MDH0487901.1 hypothetical protein [Klebsiella michiganensis]MDM6773949.1 hypothetical protein [Klebsiella michiganensis]HDS6468690.1 hypothetical protein [Klebsiella michiganensis]HDT0416783.1 hypothetical protein [Klebsiella michiganensis]HDT0617490.1 hypothetical protein [Klebsiella michiganensis]
MADNTVHEKSDTPLVPMAPISANEIRHTLATNPEPVKPERSPTIVDALIPLPKFKAVQGYNPYAAKGELSGYESFATDFAGSMSPEETTAIKHQVDAKKIVFGINSTGEFKTLMASSAIGVILCIALLIMLYRRLKR